MKRLQVGPGTDADGTTARSFVYGRARSVLFLCDLDQIELDILQVLDEFFAAFQSGLVFLVVIPVDLHVSPCLGPAIQDAEEVEMPWSCCCSGK